MELVEIIETKSNSDFQIERTIFVIFDEKKHSVFTKGHRVVQGLYVDNNLVIATEHGPRGGDEINILKKISEWPRCIDTATHKLEPHRIPTYLYELASLFHSYWNLGKQQPEKRFINDQKSISPNKLIFLKAISNVIKSGMDIVGVETPDKM